MTMVTTPITTATIIWRNSIRKGFFHHSTAEIQQVSSYNLQRFLTFHAGIRLA
jgi:hypothetical protein